MDGSPVFIVVAIIMFIAFTAWYVRWDNDNDDR